LCLKGTTWSGNAQHSVRIFRFLLIVWVFSRLLTDTMVFFKFSLTLWFFQALADICFLQCFQHYYFLRMLGLSCFLQVVNFMTLYSWTPWYTFGYMVTLDGFLQALYDSDFLWWFPSGTLWQWFPMMVSFRHFMTVISFRYWITVRFCSGIDWQSVAFLQVLTNTDFLEILTNTL
jgi:hypothetical protein